jgi:hypothetical protein
MVPRFNPPAEPARTVGFGKRDSARTVGFGNQAASAREIPEEPGSERTRERFDCEREREIGCSPCVRPSVTTGRREK